MRKKDLTTLDVFALQSRRKRAKTVSMVIYSLILFYIGFMVYLLVTKDWDTMQFAPLVAGFAALVAAIASLRRQISSIDQELASRGTDGA